MTTETFTQLATAAAHREPLCRFPLAVEQLTFLWREMSAGEAGSRAWLAFLANWFRGGRVVVAAYRCKRFWYLLLGGAHRVSWLWMWPIYGWCRQLGGRHEIHTPAQIGCGFRVIHCSLACGVSPCAVIGQNLYLTGGNFIGGRRLHMKPGDIQLGDNVELGLCSLLIGPLNVGDRARIGAGATVVKDVPAGATVVGAPVRILCAEVGE